MNVKSTNGENLSADASQVKDHLRAAGESAASAARSRAQQAQRWARGQWDDLQGRVEAQPYRAAAVAMGIGLVTGIVMMALARRSPRYH